MTAAALRVEGLCKRFGDSDALCDVSLEVRPREVVGLVGVNGAGKSTLLELIAGVMQPDAGQIKVRGTAVRWRKPRDAADAGIGLMFQEPSLVPGISVAENIMLGHEGAGVRLGVYRWKELCALAQVRLAEVGMNISPAAATQSLSFAERQLVGFAKAIAVEARTREAPVFLLDEPTSALDDQGVAAVLRVVEQLRTRASVVFVSHRLEEVLRVCDRIYVMKDGRCTAERQGRTCTATALQLLMVGQAIGSDAARAARSPSAASPCLEVRQLSRRHAYADVSLVLNHGEVIGITGSAGAGCEEFCRTLFGIVAPHSGTILVDGRAVALRDPADAVALGIGYVPAERTSEGIMGAMSVEANMTLTHLARRGDRKAVSRRCDRHAVQRWIERLRITTTSAGARASELSGGNQQKVALAKWLIGGQPRVLILDHPLRGLDVLARRDILEIIRELARDGVGIIIVADTLADLMAASDTVIVMRDGRIRARYSMAEDRPTEQTILERMV